MRDAKKILLMHLKVFLFLILYIVVSTIFNIGCPIRRVIHMPCPACGMTRAWLEVFKLNFEQAFEYHPLFFFLPLYVLLLLHSNTSFIKKIPRLLYYMVVLLGGASIVGLYVYRIIYGFGPV